MKNRQREAGILMPVFSLAGEYGIGSFGKEARDFVDLLQETGNRIWQVLPMGLTLSVFFNLRGKSLFYRPSNLERRRTSHRGRSYGREGELFFL